MQITETVKDWNYKTSVEKMKVIVPRWKNISIEMLQELYVARLNLKAQGKTILMSTHSFDDCADLAQRILVLINGEIAFMTSDVNKDHFKQKYLELVSITN